MIKVELTKNIFNQRGGGLFGLKPIQLTSAASEADDDMEKLYDRCGKEKLNKGIKTDIDRINMR